MLSLVQAMTNYEFEDENGGENINATQSMNDSQKRLVLFSNEVMKSRALDKKLIFVPQLNSGNVNTNAFWTFQ
jgi:hypothetical protein